MAVPGDGVETLDDVIASLEKLREEVGGGAAVAVRGRDGCWSEFGTAIVQHEWDEPWVLVTNGLEITPGFEVER